METETHHEIAPVSEPLPAKKMGKLRSSYLLAIEGLELLKKDKQVLLFPALSLITSIAFFGIFCIIYLIFSGGFDAIGSENTSYDTGAIGYGIVLLLYLAIAFITTFFQAGLTAIVGARINGKSMTFQEGVNMAKTHAEKLFLWSLISATVGVILGLISDRSQWFGKLVSFFLSATWGIITFFIVPALVFEKGNVSDAIKSSADTFKKTWGETIVVNFSAGLFFGLVMLLCVVVFGGFMALGFVFLPIVLAVPIFFLLLTILMIFLVGISILSSTINSIFRVALYEYAKAGHIADTFAPELILSTLKKSS